MKISIITVVHNRVNSILSSIESVRTQSYKNIEHVIVDGGSTDGTAELLYRVREEWGVVISEKDKGIYDAINKGLSMATGDIVGLLHSDDIFVDNGVLSDVVHAMVDQSIHAVYGNLQYVAKNGRPIRRWKSREYRPGDLRYGWMPPHPTMFFRSSFLKGKHYDQKYQISGDYDFIVRCISTPFFRSRYINRDMVIMGWGGASNASIASILKKTLEDYKIIKQNKIGGVFTVILKNIRKLNQFLV